MFEDLISVIIPCYNVGNYISDCIESLKNQTYKNFEALFINDGSTDQTLNKLKILCKNIPNFKIIEKENGGVSSARNLGVSISKGKYLCFLDSDDMLAPTFIEELYTNLIYSESDCSVCGNKNVCDSYKYTFIKNSNKKKNLTFSNQEEILIDFLSKPRLKFFALNKLYKTELLKKLENYPNVFNCNISYGEDLDFVFRYFSLCNKLIYSNSKLYLYRQRYQSVTHSKFNRKNLSVFEGLENNIKTFEINKKVLPYLKALKYVLSIENLWKIYCAKYKNKEDINYLFQNLKNCKPYLVKAKKLNFKTKRLTPFAQPFMKFLFIRRLK